MALLVDVSSGQTLYARDPDRRFLPASVTKVMTAYVAFEQIARDRLHPRQQFRVSPETAREWSGKGTTLWLEPNTTVPVDVLLRGVTTVSANDGAVVLAEGFAGGLAIWAKLMNAEASRLGMTGSHFESPNGWPDGGATYVTAHDLAKLGTALVTRHAGLYHHYFGHKSFTWKGITQYNRDPTLGVVAGADGIKTGYTNEAGYNFLGSAARDGRRLIMVVAGARTAGERARASRALLEWGFGAWQSRPLFDQNEAVGSARVQDGDSRSVRLVATGPIGALLPSGSAEPIRLRIRYVGPLLAPIAKGARIAELEVTSGGRTGRVPLVAGESVGQANLFDRLVNGLLGMVA